MTAIAISLGQNWATRGDCHGTDDPEAWFPGEFDDAHPARTICSTCPVMRDCLRYAVDHEKYGLWGGATEKQRDAIRNGLTAGINTCDLCGSQWVGRKALRHHMTVDHADQTHPHVCECGRRFATDHGMRSHQGKAHGKDAA